MLPPLRPKPRRWVLLLHVLVSVAWVGAEVCLLVLAAVGLANGARDPELARAVYRALALLAGWLYLPASLATLLSGLWLSLATRWGLVRHWWVLLKLAATVALVIGGNLAVVPAIETLGPGGAFRFGAVSALSVGTFLLVGSTVVSVLKPWGRVRPR